MKNSRVMETKKMLLKRKDNKKERIQRDRRQQLMVMIEFVIDGR